MISQPPAVSPPRQIFRPEAVARHRERAERPVLPHLLTLAEFGTVGTLLRLLQTLVLALPRRLGGARRVPVVLQMTLADCGAACLAMVLRHHGRQTSLQECRDALGVGRDGVTARTLAEAARGFGLRVRAYSLGPDDWPRVALPAIAHWNFDHFLVVERWAPEQVDVVDPARGRCRLNAAEFADSFTGVALTFEASGELAPRLGSGQQPAWQSFLARARRAPGVLPLLGWVLGASLLLQLVGLTVPFATRLVVDDVLQLQVTSLLLPLALGVLAVAGTQAATGYLRAALLVNLQTRLDRELMVSFWEHVLRLPLRFFLQRTSGDLLMRLGSNAVLRETLTSQAISTVLDTALVLAYVAALLSQDVALGLLALALGAAQVGLLLVTARPMHDLTERHLNTQGRAQAYLVEAVSGIATLKACGAEPRALDHWTNLYQAQLNVGVQRGHLGAVLDTALGVVRTLAPLVLLCLGAARVLDGSLTLGSMLALNALALGALTPLASLVASGQQWQTAGAHLAGIADVLDTAPEQDRRLVRAAPPLQGRIELDSVTFRYDPRAPAVLQDISLTVEPGQKVALVGRSGSGKSTLGLLLLGLYPPSAGEIRYDGVSLAELDYGSLRARFGVALQDPALFSGSIRHNVSLCAPNMTTDDVLAATRVAAIDEDIDILPMGLETQLAEGGAGLSGGQRQRLAIARAVAHRPAVLLLDEATSHLDVLTEQRVDVNLSALACTRIVIAHRLSTVRNADLIVVLDNGRIVERGTHDALLVRGGHYAALVRGQEPTTLPGRDLQPRHSATDRPSQTVNRL